MKLYNKDLIIKLLTKHEHLRDSDMALICNIWWMELKEAGLKDATVLDVLTYISSDNLTNPESIRRARQKVQEQMPELRGKNYKKRHKEEQNFKEKVINY